MMFMCNRFLLAGAVVVTLAGSAMAQTPVSYAAGHCPTGSTDDPWCKAGESVVGYYVDVPKTPRKVTVHWPDCTANVPVKASDVLKALKAVAYRSKNPYVIVAAEVANEVAPRLGGTPGDLFTRWNGQDTSNCALLAVSVPVGAKITRVQLTVSSENTIPGGCGPKVGQSYYRVGIDKFARSYCGPYTGFIRANPRYAQDQATILAY